MEMMNSIWFFGEGGNPEIKTAGRPLFFALDMLILNEDFA